MARFWRINNMSILDCGAVPKVGFEKNNPSYIPDEYLNNKEFVIMRTAHGIGDWCIMSALHRLLKTKYPDCKVYIPSIKMMEKTWGTKFLKGWGYGTYNCAQISHDVFINNPYVEFIDSYVGEIFHDHYRIYDEKDDKIPLVEQMLDFWQFEKEEMVDSTPDIYFSEKEKKQGDDLIKKLVGNKKYGFIGLSSSYGDSTPDTSALRNIVKEKDKKMPIWLYYGETPINKSDLNFLKNVVSIKELGLNIRQQMYIRHKALVNIGNETGMTLWNAKYTETYVLGNQTFGAIHSHDTKLRLEGTAEALKKAYEKDKNDDTVFKMSDGEVQKRVTGKPRTRPFESGNFIRNIKYI